MGAQEIKVGDIVRLKSGSPKMTVTFVDPDNGALTVHMWAGNSTDGGKFIGLENTDAACLEKE